MFKNGQTYFKNLAVFTLQDFKSIFDHFLSLWIKGLTILWTLYIEGLTDALMTLSHKLYPL